MTRTAELRHLLSGPSCDEHPMGAGLVEVKFRSNRAGAVLTRAKEVLEVVFNVSDPWLTLDEWTSRLPPWFVDACAPARTEVEEEVWLAQWRTLSAPEQIRAELERVWSLDDWLYWFEPDERAWFWWDSSVNGFNEGVISIEVPGWPFPVGALVWLLRAAGAESVDVDGE